jgi:transglutaminase-like putative cysteine protease
MIASRNLGVVAAAATVLAAAPLSAIFESWTWLIESVIAVAVVAGVAALTRLVRAPLWAQVMGMLAGLLLALTWLFPSGSELLTFLPAPGTLSHFADLLTGSLQDMRSYGVEVPDTDPLLFIAVLGVGAVAVLVDVLAVGLRRPALAGLPMLAIYSVPVAVYVDSVPAIPFVVGAAGYLWLLVTDNVDRVRRFGRRFTGEGRDVDVWEASPLAAAGRRLAVVGVALAVALPLAVPGMTGGLLDTLNGGAGTGTGTGRAGQGGSPGRIDLFASLSGQLNQSEVSDLVKVRTSEPDPFYLRLGVADELRPDGFRTRSASGKPVTRDLPDPTERAGRGVQQSRYQATVEVKNLAMPLLPVYAEPVRTEDLNGNWLYDPNLQVVFSNRDTSRNKRYVFDYVRSTYSPAALRAAQPLPADHPVRRQFTATPTVVPEVETLVEGLVQGKRTDYDKVLAIYQHFSADNGFSYRLSTASGSSGQDIVNFLTNKVGYCQQYAAAMAWLVRAAGIPSRVAFGFTRGSQNGDTYTLTNRNLHAWTEVYFDAVGWVPFDATPAYGVQGATRTAWAPDTDAPEPSSPGAGSASTPEDPDASAGPAGPDNADRDTDTGLSLANDTPAEQPPVWPWWTAGVLALLALLAVPALRRLALRRRRGGQATHAPATATAAGADGPGNGTRMMVLEDASRARADAHAAWDELMDTLVDFRVPVDRSETPRATADRLVRDTFADDSAAVGAARLLGRAEERARYARDPLTGERLVPALRAVRGALSARADRRTRLVAAVLPPSVLLRWRLAVADTSGRLVALTGRARFQLLRWNPRRLLADRAAR